MRSLLKRERYIQNFKKQGAINDPPAFFKHLHICQNLIQQIQPNINEYAQNNGGYGQENQFVKQISPGKILPLGIFFIKCKAEQIEPACNGNVHAHKGKKPGAYRFLL